MTKPKKFEKPAGLKDYLPEASAKLRAIENKMLDCMKRWGYRQIITPTLEYYDTVGVASTTSDHKLFKLMDRRGTTLVLRSEMTAPIARVVASVLRDAPLPLRLSYHSNVFRSIEEEAGRDAEFFQTGVELIGDASPDADAEVVALAIACLKSVGVKTFKIALGHVGFLNGLLQEALDGKPEVQEALKESLVNRDHVGYRMLLDKLALPEKVRKELEELLKLSGGQEICEKARTLTANETARRALAQLCEVWAALEEYGACENVVIDLTMIGDFSYYTGLTFEGFAHDLGFPVVSGGRYDNLLGQFGRPAPATGFALKTNRIMELVNGSMADATRRVLVIYDGTRRKEAIRHAQSLRMREGWMVETWRVDEPGTDDAQPFAEGGIQPLAEGGYRFRDQVFHEIVEFIGPSNGG